ncbi:hypothetical protein [Cohnella soli]|uniref:NodB homology domain-containing protein n=1 Tax=Cohnella soli TaxID=425005 RepID=A0ABW0HQY4_9BACL
MLTIVWNTAEIEQMRNEGRDSYTPYLLTMLNDLGLSYRVLNHEEWLQNQPGGVTIVAGRSTDPRWSSACLSYCEQGNALLVIGDVFGLDEVLGVTCTGRVREGWIDWANEGLSEGLRSSFHFFDAVCVESALKEVRMLGSILQLNGTACSEPAVSIRSIGPGTAALLTVDVMKTFCMIQQGVSVVRDGNPAADGSGAINDGILKTDDAAVLDWQRDREPVESGGVPFFLHPIVDEWRILLMRLLYQLHESVDAPLAQIWYWPNGIPAIGHISHDTDGNSAEHAQALLARLKEADIRSTWCIIMPGYDREINSMIESEEHEVALHFNSMEAEIPESRWSESDFRYQLSLLQEQFPNLTIVTNKNHYLRWEGDAAFYHWCERAGVKVEQSRGGTRQGNKGFLAGTCHPFTPIGSVHERNRPLDVLSLPTLAWDPPLPLRCTKQEAFALLDRATDVNGVAHFLFHPAMLIQNNDQVGSLLVDLVRYGATRGLAWWTAEQIWQWRSVRKQVTIQQELDADQKPKLVIVSDTALSGLTLLVSKEGQWQAWGDSTSSRMNLMKGCRTIERFGCLYTELILDIQKGRTEATCI